MFMGTPEISAICLDRLLKDGHEVISVVTGEDKVRGRKNVLTPTPVKALAAENGIRVYTPKTLKTDEFFEVLKQESPDIIVVVAYGKILPKSVIDFPKYGCINLHVSLLPKYRGAAPMQRAIMEGEEETGVSIMQMDEGLDTGDVIALERFPISKTDNFESIHDRSALVGSVLLSEILPKIEKGEVKRVKQDDSQSTYAKKVEREDCKLDFTLPAKKLDFIIRGVTPIPGAFAYHLDRVLKIADAEVVSENGAPGEVIKTDGSGEGYITVACGEGALKIKTVIPEGKGRMTAGDYVRGRKINTGDILK